MTQPGPLAGQQLRRAGGADALDRDQRVPQDIDALGHLVARIPQVQVTRHRGEQARDSLLLAAEQSTDHMRAPGDIQQCHRQQVVGGDLVGRIAAEAAECHAGERLSGEVRRDCLTQAVCGEVRQKAGGGGADRAIGW
jgi:hypothetical protein